MLWHGDSIINPAIYQLLVVQAIFFNHTPRPEPFFTCTPRPEPVEGRLADRYVHERNPLTPSNRMSCRDPPTSVPARRASFDRLRTRYRVEKQKIHLCSAHWRMALNLAPHLVTLP
jgi:hypothetical protein